MIFLVVAAFVGMGGIVAYLAHEKGRSPVLWGLYGMALAPVALPQILLARRRADEDASDVWAEIRHTIQTQTVNEPHPKMTRPEPGRADLRQDPAAPGADWLKSDAWAAAEKTKTQDHTTTEQPNRTMFADKSNTRTQPLRAEPSFSASAEPAQRTAANDFRLDPNDRLGAYGPSPASAPGGDHRSRAPLSYDPDEPRATGSGFGGPLIAAVAGLAAVVVAVVVLAPTLRQYIPAGMPFSTAPEVKNVAAAGLNAPMPTDTSDTPQANGAAAAPGSAPAIPKSSGSAFGDQPTQTGPQDIGTAKLAAPIPTKQDAKAPPPPPPSSATETNLALATRGMKPVDVPDEPKSEAAPPADSTKGKAAPQAKSAPKAAPKLDAPKAVAKAEPKAPAKAEPAAKKAPPEDFLSMVNKAIGPEKSSEKSNAGASASATPGSEIEQVSESNDLVLAVQKKLRERGYDPGTMDGRTGPKTVQAIRDYQQSVGLPADGLIDVTLMERLGVVGKRLQFPTR